MNLAASALARATTLACRPSAGAAGPAAAARGAAAGTELGSAALTSKKMKSTSGLPAGEQFGVGTSLLRARARGVFGGLGAGERGGAGGEGAVRRTHGPLCL